MCDVSGWGCGVYVSVWRGRGEGPSVYITVATIGEVLEVMSFLSCTGDMLSVCCQSSAAGGGRLLAAALLL